MKIADVSATQFAKWTFEHDLKAGCFDENPEIKSWDNLTKEDQLSYLDEGEYYICNHDKEDWPIEILLHLEDHGLTKEKIKEYQESGWR